MDQNTLKAHFLTTYDQYADAIYRFCQMKTSSAGLAEDLTQETFMRLWQRMREGQKIEHEQALLYTIARNLVIDWYRKKKEQSLDAMMEAGTDFAEEGGEGVTTTAEVREVLEVVNQLDLPSREVLLLRFVEGYAPHEIAKFLDTNANVVSVRINRAIKKVQSIIRPNE
jgi:RNA polymerase sigma-70 factor (ECF subfamily)